MLVIVTDVILVVAELLVLLVAIEDLSSIRRLLGPECGSLLDLLKTHEQFLRG